MGNVNLKEASKTNWATSPLNGDGYPGDENIKIGCLQRIADATELMAKDRQRLIDDLEWTKRSRDSWQKTAERLERSNAALRGVITKLKKKSNHSI